MPDVADEVRLGYRARILIAATHTLATHHDKPNEESCYEARTEGDSDCTSLQVFEHSAPELKALVEDDVLRSGIYFVHGALEKQ